jgi:hypothetical protein
MKTYLDNIKYTYSFYIDSEPIALEQVKIKTKGRIAYITIYAKPNSKIFKVASGYLYGKANFKNLRKTLPRLINIDIEKLIMHLKKLSETSWQKNLASINAIERLLRISYRKRMLKKCKEEDLMLLANYIEGLELESFNDVIRKDIIIYNISKLKK